MEIRELEALEGTKYEVVVLRDDGGDYEVDVRKPAYSNDPFVTFETVSIRYLHGNATQKELNSLVREIIQEDHPSLVGKYKYEEETVDDQH